MNQLSSLDVSTCISLTYLGCYFNELKSLDVSGCTALESLRCAHNRLSSLDVSNDTALQHLNCSENQLTSLDVSNNIALYWLGCDNNQLSSLDVSNNPLIGSDNFWGYLGLRNMPSLVEVCVWTLPFPPWYVEVDITGSPNVEFKDCSLGIEESTHSGLRIYPNPTKDLLSIESDNPDHYSIQITSLNGQQLYSTTMDGTTHQINLSSVQKGVYFFTIRSKDYITTRKIIKL
jgi:Leucine-rich repeat (LRR) protein